MNVLILAAGRGQRFVDAGYTIPKPLIKINEETLIENVVKNLDMPANYIFLVLKEHYENYDLEKTLRLACGDNKCTVIKVDSVTEGAACTALLARWLINNDEPLLIVNSDQLVDWNSGHFLNFVTKKNCDGAILTFNCTNSPKWSYVKLDEDTGCITEVAEKRPISQIATVGIYFWSKGSHYVQSAEEMIQRNERVNNEFYVAPTYNTLIEQGKKIIPYPVAEFIGLGTPSDLNKYLKQNKC